VARFAVAPDAQDTTATAATASRGRRKKRLITCRNLAVALVQQECNERRIIRSTETACSADDGKITTSERCSHSRDQGK
jgi:hypothetical protein